LEVVSEQLAHQSVLRVQGDMRLWGRPDLQEQLLQSYGAGLRDETKEVILNMRGLTSVDTMGIAALVRVLIEITKHDLKLKVVLPSGTVGESLRRVRIFEPWPEYREESAALKEATPPK
jgi:anti-anti-sigma factor